MTALESLAARLFWWKTPSEALADPSRFLAQVMTLGTVEDLAIARESFSVTEFREVLAHPPAGIFDPRSWTYWHLALGLGKPGELPRRRLD